MLALLTGFTPFDGETINPSWEAVRGFDRKEVNNFHIRALELPTEFKHASDLLSANIDALNPDLVLCFGQAGGRAAISLERVAINLADARIADNAGAQPKEQWLLPGAPVAYFAPLDLGKLQQALLDAQIPAEISLSAGSFVCNEVFFRLCHLQATVKPKLRGGFVHIPYAPDQASRLQATSHAVSNQTKIPSMAISEVQRAIVVLLQALDPA